MKSRNIYDFVIQISCSVYFSDVYCSIPNNNNFLMARTFVYVWLQPEFITIARLSSLSLGTTFIYHNIFLPLSVCAPSASCGSPGLNQSFSIYSESLIHFLPKLHRYLPLIPRGRTNEHHSQNSSLSTNKVGLTRRGQLRSESESYFCW